MASNKIWFVRYVAGNPEMFTKVRSIGPVTKKQALEDFNIIAAINWRVWVEKYDGTRIKESEIETKWREAGAGSMSSERSSRTN